MRRLSYAILVFLLATAGYAQRKDSVLLNERSIDRPVTLHKGQVRVGVGYMLNVITKRFGDSGDEIQLSDEGLASVKHAFALNLKYGVLDFLEVEVAGGSQRHAVREQTVLLIGVPTVQTSSVKEYNGREDIYLGLNARYPFKTKKIDVELLSGINLPSAKSNPDKPSHMIKHSTDEFGDFYNVDYRYNYNMGAGVPVVQIGGLVKYRTPKVAFSILYTHRHGLKDGESFEWIAQLNEKNEFNYREDPYSYRLADQANYYVEIEFQAAPWLNLIANVAGINQQLGWTEEDGVRTAIPDAKLWLLTPGFEILVTPKLWLRQRFRFPVSGENLESGTMFQTMITYNFFPF